MPASYHQVSPTVWDRTFRNLTHEAQVLAFYVWTCPTRVTEGLFELRPGHVVSDTGLTIAEVDAAFSELDAAGIIAYDSDAEVVLDRYAWRTISYRVGHDKETGEAKPDRRIKGAVTRFEQVPDTPLRHEFAKLAREHCPPIAEAIGPLGPPPNEAPPKPLASPTEGASGEERRGEVPEVERFCEHPDCEAVADEPACVDDPKFRDLCHDHAEEMRAWAREREVTADA